MTTVPAGPAAASRRGPTASRRYLQLLDAWTRRELRSRHHRSALRIAWIVLQPALAVGVVLLVFGVVFDTGTDTVPFLSYVLVGMTAFRFAATSFSSASALVQNKDVMAHAHFPREVIPLSRVGSHLTDLAVGTVGMVVVAVVQGARPHLSWLTLPLSLTALVLYTGAFCVLLSTVTVFIRDVELAAPFATQALFFASPVSYDADLLPDWARWTLTVNPLSALIEALRAPLLSGAWPRMTVLLPHLLLSGALLVLAVAHLRAVDHRIVDLG